MANEITQANGETKLYGGPQLTITGSTYGTTAKAIIFLAANGYQFWKKGQAEFLNTLTVIAPGLAYTVAPVVVPMDFPPPVGGSTTSRIPFPTTDSLSSTDPLVFGGFSLIVDNMKCVLSVALPNGQSLPTGVSILYALNGGSYQSLSATNQAIQALDNSAVAANGYTIGRQITRPDSTAIDVVTTQTFA